MTGLKRRAIEPELLDKLPAADPRALRSRRDLRRVNAWMGNSAIIARRLRRLDRNGAPLRVVELGAGDGSLLWRVARQLPADWGPVTATLVDRQNLVSPATVAEFARRGWTVKPVEAEVFNWLAANSTGAHDVVVANLFLHHFADNELRRLFQMVAGGARLFVACEPERSSVALAGVRLLPVIGSNAVTRHDARISVRAGFAGHELSELWPEADGWELREERAGLFSHVFEAWRVP